MGNVKLAYIVMCRGGLRAASVALLPTCWLYSLFHLMSGEVAHQKLAT